jgi:hypothetical protein
VFGVLHGVAQSSFSEAVNEMWKLCKAGEKWQKRKSSSLDSAELGTDFSHQGIGFKAVRTGGLAKISTSAKRLLLLLVE